MGWGGVGRGGVGWGGVKIIISNDTLGHAHSHPLSHNIGKILDEESLATSKESKCITTPRYQKHRCIMYVLDVLYVLCIMYIL